MAKQKGNAVVYILIAIALFGALSYTFIRGSRTGSTEINSQRLKILASEMINAGKHLQTTVSRMRRKGCSENQFNFYYNGLGHTSYSNVQSPADFSCHIYHPAGGNMIPFQTTAGMQTFVAWQSGFGYSGDYRIDNVGTINSDLIAAIPDISLAMCNEINRQLGVTSMPSRGGNPSPSRFSGGYPNLTNLLPGGNAMACGSIAQMGGAAYRSATPTVTTYVFYTVLIER